MERSFVPILGRKYLKSLSFA
uniref:Uncharacterized protein n=1 Tax=Rhizophora mucronata TaxID=61149 RepID=A0A2P2JS04_RHIMU